MEKISIIVPIFNVERYLKDCVQSIQDQTYKNIEIILINDGSTDGSKEICKKIVLEDPSIKLINQANHGLGYARNAGMKISIGKYIMFVDSDDYLPRDAVESMYNEIKNKDADIITANYIKTNDAGKPWESPIFDPVKFPNMKISIKDYDKSFYVMNSSVCNKIFKKDFLLKNNIKFEKKLPAEDAIFSMQCLNLSNEIYFINNIIYYYRQRELANEEKPSITSNCSLEYFKGISKAYKKIYDIFKENKTLAFYRYFYAKSSTYILSKLIDTTLLTDEERLAAIKQIEWLYNLAPQLKVPMCNIELEKIVNDINAKKYFDAIEKCKILSKKRMLLRNEERINQSKPSFDFYKRISKHDKEFEDINSAAI